jgi:hypothetical protein
MSEGSRWRLVALDRPALGLVMQLAALMALPAQLSLAITLVGEDLPWSGLLGLTILPLVATGLELATGIAIARRSFARPLFAAYGVATLGFVVVAVVVFATDEGTSAVAAMALEILAGPLVILVAPLVLDLDRLDDRRSPADVAAVLFVLAVSSLIAMPVGIVDDGRVALAAHASPAIWLASILRWGVGAVTAIIALRAGRILLRPGPPAAARRALAFYVLVSIGVAVVFGGGTIGMLASEVGDHKARFLASPVAALVVSVARPLTIWAYARTTLREPIAVARRAVSMPLVWSVLWVVPLLLSRSPALRAMSQITGTALVVLLGALLCVQAVGNIVAVRAVLRNGDRAFGPAAGATVVAVVLLGVVLVWLYALLDLDSPAAVQMADNKPIWPITMLIAMLGTLAWSQRGRAA